MIDDNQTLETLKREGMHLSSYNKRAIAFMVDDMLISTMFAIIFWERFKSLTDPESLILFVNSLFIYIIIVKTIYQTIFIAMYGQTLGKMLMKIKVINRDYFDQPNWFESFQRAGMRALSEVVFYIGFIAANFTPLRQTWHDKFAKTLVVDA
jgi:uncharacterized RDD family membrane protein YckC